MKVAVLGAGIVGAACAWELAREGFSVELVESRSIGGGVTAAGMGHIVALDPLSCYSRRLWDRVAAELTADVAFDRCGTLWIAENAAQLRGAQAAYQQLGVRTETLDQAALHSAEPELAPDLFGALRVPDDSVLYPPAAAQWFVEQAVAHGAVYRRGSCAEADRTVDATGFGTCVAVPVTPRKGHLLITVPHPGFCRHQLVELGYIDRAHGTEQTSVAFNLQPRPTGQLLLGSSRQHGVDTRAVEAPIMRRMLARAERFVPRIGQLAALRCWTGFRPATPDGQPLIGPVPDRPELLLALGHEGLGITSATGTARLIADILLDRASEIDRAPYDPARLMEPAHA